MRSRHGPQELGSCLPCCLDTAVVGLLWVPHGEARGRGEGLCMGVGAHDPMGALLQGRPTVHLGREGRRLGPKGMVSIE